MGQARPRADTVAPFHTATNGLGEPVVKASTVEHLLTVAEVAEHLRVCRASVYALCQRGELPHVHISNAIRVARLDVADFLARATNRPV